MSLHYNAFISYKHAELDNKVAAMVESKLEHYHIPYNLRKKTGKKKIERIFRDTDELPITSDLSGTIAEALENADYLIVICSTNTCKSMWVEREINLFLQNHTQDQILTVLADGEPADVIPEVLKNREVTKVTENGETETVIEPVEPLSCDFRLPKRDAINIELPRLAAALIGCSYSELINRQRQYRMKRLTAVLSGIVALSLGFGGYMFYNRQLINSAYKDTLIDQSRSWATESDKMLKEEDRITAVQLALETLPNEKNQDRPVIPEAIRAITGATISYVPKSNNNIGSVWNYSMPGNRIMTFEASDDGNTLMAMDSSYNVKMWNTTSHEELLFLPRDYIAFTIVNNDIAFLGLSSKELRLVSTATGETVSSLSAPEDVGFSCSTLAITDKNIYVPGSPHKIYKLSANSLEIEEAFDTSGFPEYKYTNNICVSPSDNKIALILASQDDEPTTLVIYDTLTNDHVSLVLDQADLFNEKSYIHRIYWYDDNSLCLSASAPDSSNYSISNSKTLSNDHEIVMCFDPSDLSTKWTCKYPYSSVHCSDELTALPDMNALASYSGNTLVIIDMESGEIQHTYNLNDPIIDMLSYKEPGTISVVTKSGILAHQTPKKGEKDVSELEYIFPSDLDHYDEGGFVRVERSNEIIQFKPGVYDEDVQEFAGCPSDLSPTDYVIQHFDSIVTMLYEENSTIHLAYYNSVTKEFIGEIELEGKELTAYDVLDCQNGTVYLHCKDKQHSIVSVDTSTGEKKQSAFSDGYIPADNLESVKGYIVYEVQNGGSHYACTRNLATGEEHQYPISVDGSDGSSMHYDPDMGIIYYAGTESDQIIDVKKNKVSNVALPNGWNRTNKVFFPENSNMIVISNGKKILATDFSGKILYEITCPDSAPCGVSIYKPKKIFAQKVLLVSYESGKLSRYNAESGAYIGQIDISLSSDNNSDSVSDKGTSAQTNFEYDTDNGLLYLSDISTLNIIDTNQWVTLTDISPCYGHDSTSDTFITSLYTDKNPVQLGYFKHYSLEELIEKGKKMTGGIEMSDAKKEKYGID